MKTIFSPGFFGRIFTNAPPWTLTLSPQSPTLEYAGHSTALSIEVIAQGRITEGFLWSSVAIGKLELTGLSTKQAHVLINNAKEAAHQKQQTEKEEARLKSEFARLSEPMPSTWNSLNSFLNGSSYIRDAHRRDFISQNKNELDTLLELQKLLEEPFFSKNEYATIKKQLGIALNCCRPPYQGLITRNKRFVDSEIIEWADYFRQVEKSPLTQEQQVAVVVHEDRNRLIAAAGSGKSSTLVAKVGYALQKGYVKQDQILALAFNNDAAKELSERLEKRLGLTIKAQTFHSLGNEIIRNTCGPKHLLLQNGLALNNQLETLLREDIDYCIRFYMHHAIHQHPEPELEFTSVDEYESHMRQVGKRNKEKDVWGIPSLRGEYVRSYEELAIANWLYVQGIQYRYEELYPHDVTYLEWKKYEPDFCYPLPDGSMLYHEHFALSTDNSSPFGASYVLNANQKRELHTKHNTPLIESWSRDFRSGRIFIELENKLKEYGVPFAPMSRSELEKTLKIKPHGDFVRLISALIAHAKESGLDEANLRTRANELHDQVRTQSFLSLFFPILQRYTAYLDQIKKIDFADMIGSAVQQVTRPGGYSSPYKLILVDEFQDISRGRAKLVQALLAQHQDSVLFSVGDDWQSINRFAGSDLSIMRNFEDEFGKSETNYLSKTFRSNQGISNVAAKFVSANADQLKKDVVAINPKTDGVVRIMEFSDLDDQRSKIKTKLDLLAEKAKIESRLITVMILGRYKYETTGAFSNEQINAWNATYAGRLQIKQKEKKKDDQITLEALDSVHGSKGLEADFVLIHSLQTQSYGFPSEMEDDPLLSLVLAKRESFPYAEERRLFYVAVTRAKEEVTLYVSKNQPSPFVLELLGKEYGDTVAFESKSEKPEPCPKCNQGYLMLKNGKHGSFMGCSAFKSNDCNYSRSIERARAG